MCGGEMPRAGLAAGVWSLLTAPKMEGCGNTLRVGAFMVKPAALVVVVLEAAVAALDAAARLTPRSGPRVVLGVLVRVVLGRELLGRPQLKFSHQPLSALLVRTRAEERGVRV
jgi:hypothetical protein